MANIVFLNTCERCVKSKMPHVPVRTPLGHLTATRPLQIVATDYTILYYTIIYVKLWCTHIWY